MAKKSNKFVEGISLILLGVFFIGVQKGLFDWNQIWPFSMIIPGIGFYLSYLKDRKNYPVLMPGTILLTLGIYFVFLTEYGWYHMEQFWPIFVFAPGLGFFMMFIGSGLKKNFLIPCVILITISLLFFFKAWEFLEYWPVIIILAGLYLIYTGYKGKEKKEDEQEY